jgi:hypothetical protein
VIAAAVYILSALTTMLCAVRLLHAWRRTKLRFLLWSGLCFVGLSVSNTILVVDLLIVPDIDLFLWRNLSALAAMMLLLYGLIWEME